MYIAVISKSEHDFMNHLKDSDNNYVRISHPDMAVGNRFDKIEVAPKGKKNPMYEQIKSYCEFRLVH